MRHLALHFVKSKSFYCVGLSPDDSSQNYIIMRLRFVLQIADADGPPR
jgi:hypothetical protein